MGIPRPKFCVGEVVNLATIRGTSYTKGYEITYSEYCVAGARDPSTGGFFTVSAWHYKVSNDPIPGAQEGDLWEEPCLRKRPQNNWENSVWTPAEIKEKCPA